MINLIFLFRQKKVVELLDKNYRIHCSIHNKVNKRDKILEIFIFVYP
jgi:hypothetical protein